MKGEDDWQHPFFWAVLATLLFCCAGVMYWLRIVYSRFEVTEGMPIEYGVVTAYGLLGGLLFFDEIKYTTPFSQRVSM